MVEETLEDLFLFTCPEHGERKNFRRIRKGGGAWICPSCLADWWTDRDIDQAIERGSKIMLAPNQTGARR